MRGYHDEARPEAPFWAARRPSADPRLRASDAERAEVADELSRHYAEGRFNDSEFRERLDKVMAAKTRGDLAGLLADVPRLDAGPPPEVVVHHHGPRAALVVVAVLALVALSSAPPHFPFFVLAVLCVLLWRREHGGFRWRGRGWRRPIEERL